MNKFLYGTHQVEHLYITDNDSHKNLARRDYVPGFESKSTRRQKSPPSRCQIFYFYLTIGIFDGYWIGDGTFFQFG